MASLAQEYGVKGKAAKAPIATHAAFPFIVALWFAALLGMGSLVVPVALMEQIAVSTGLASIVPATAPPLGFTARALIALVFTGLGALAGLLIARQVAKAHMPQQARRYTGTMQRPIDAHAELGADGLDGFRPKIQPKGRRSLAIELDHGPSELLDFAPLPGKRVDAETSALEMLDLDAREFLPQAWTPDPSQDLGKDLGDDDELELTEDLEAAMPAFPRSLAAAPPLSDAVPGFQTFADDSGDDVMDDRPPFSMPQGSAPRPSVRQEFRAPPETVIAPAWSDDEVEMEDDVSEEVAPEPVSFPEPTPMAFDEPVEEAEFSPPPLAFSPPSLAREVPADFGAATPAPQQLSAQPIEPEQPAADLDDMGLVQLAQRLGNSIERRREQQALRARAVPIAAVAPLAPLGDDSEMAAPDEAAEAMAAYFARPAAPAPEAIAEPDADEPDFVAPPPRQMFEPVVEETAPPPVAYRPLAGFSGFDEDEDEDDDVADLAASFSLPLGRKPEAAPAAPEPAMPVAVPVEDAGEAEPDYASLLALRNPFHERTEVFVRIEDEPDNGDVVGQTAVVFPAERPLASVPAPAFAPPAVSPQSAAAPLDNEENERALREALLSLQRMSGAA